MGGVVPKGENNDDLIDNLVEAKFITNENVITVFRQVDRGDFIPSKFIDDAYRDAAMRSGNIHLSAPCIYSSVLENMDLKEGVSFLNVGSGTGYLSTLAGQILGPHDVNHGIEIHRDAVDYSHDKIQNFMKFSRGFNLVKFCKPSIICGNGICLDKEFRQYDRIYIGARVEESFLPHFKDLVKVGGILVFPFGESLVKYTKLTPSDWDEKFLLSVQFSDLIEKRPQDQLDLKIYTQPWTLKETARKVILNSIIGKKDLPLEYDRDKIEELNALPIPNILVRYLKYYRDDTSFVERERELSDTEDGDEEKALTMQT